MNTESNERCSRHECFYLSFDITKSDAKTFSEILDEAFKNTLDA
jgi:hypothetical protein